MRKYTTTWTTTYPHTHAHTHTLGPGPVWKHATRHGLAGHAAAAAGSCCGGPPRRRNTWHTHTNSNSAPPKAHSTKGVCKLEDFVFLFSDPNRIFLQAQARTVLCTKVVPTSMSVPRRATKRPANISAVVLMHGWSRPVFYDVSCARRTCIPRHEVGREQTIIGPTWSIVMSIHVLRRSDLS